MDTEIEKMEVRLGAAVPSQYRDFVRQRPPERLQSTLAAPDEILALNLERQAEGAGGPVDFGLVLFCEDGDCLLLRRSDNSGKVYKWSHETRDVDPAGIDANVLLDHLSRQTSSEIDADDSTVVISRVVPWSRSILDPICLDALDDAARRLHDIVVFNGLETVNPFTRETVRLDVRGIEIQVPDRIQLVLNHGRLIGSRGDRPIPPVLSRLALLLGAKIFSNDR